MLDRDNVEDRLIIMMVVNIRKMLAKETAKEGNEIGEMFKFERRHGRCS